MYRNIWRKTINLWPLSALKVDEVPDCWQVLHDILQYSSATQPPIHSVPCHFGKHQSEKNNTQQFWKHRLNSLTHKGATGDLCQYLKLWQQFTRSNHNRTLCLGNAVDNRLFTECCIQCHNYKAKQVVTVTWRKATSYSPGCTNVHPSSTPQSASAPYWWWPCWVPSSISTAGHFQACPGPATSPPPNCPLCVGIWTHLIRFVGPTGVNTAHSILIGSAIFAQLTAESPLPWLPLSPSKLPIHVGDLHPI